jgi:hypothetical protein
MTYRLIIKPSAEKDPDRLPRPVQRRVLDRMATIQTDPRAPGSVKPAGAKSTYRDNVPQRMSVPRPNPTPRFAAAHRAASPPKEKAAPGIP